jgi:hypothetical protein
VIHNHTPTNPLIQKMGDNDLWMKAVAMLLYRVSNETTKYPPSADAPGGTVAEFRIGEAEITELSEMFSGDLPCVLVKVEGKGREEQLVMRLMPSRVGVEEARKFARRS